LRYEGADKLTLENNNLTVKVGKHETVERTPYAYQYNEKGEKIQRECHFVVDGKTVTFKIKEYDKNKDIIIDPTLVFASYSGSHSSNFGLTATYDSEGNLYGGGTVFTVGYPYTTGVFQTIYGGGSSDIAISKFSSDGSQILFATYLGGNNADVPHSLIVNGNNELYVLATTGSSNYPTTTGAYDRTFNGGTSKLISGTAAAYTQGIDVAISHFNLSGTQLLGSTYFGGSANDGINDLLVYNYADELRGEIQLDGNGDVCIASSTLSVNLPTTAGVFQPNHGGGTQDGFIAKFSANLQSLIWCSYFGGNSIDVIYSMDIDAQNNLYLCGGTTSTNLATSVNAVNPSHVGGVDGFIAKIAPNGQSILSATYLGSGQYDQTFLISLTGDENVVVTGQSTAANSNFWIQNASWSHGRGQFLTNLSNDLSQINWSTSFGDVIYNTPNIVPSALMVDLCGNIHISGWGGVAGNGSFANFNTFGLPVTNDALQSSTDGNDFYFLSIDSGVSRLVYATFFGGPFSREHVDGGTSRFDKKGIVYQAVCASCDNYDPMHGYITNDDFPTTPGAAYERKDSVNCNLGVIKLNFNLGMVVADFSMPNVVCNNVPVTFANLSKGMSDPTTYYFWDFGDGTSDTAHYPIHVYHTPGSYDITLIVTDSTSCNITDTLTKTIIVGLNKSTVLPDIAVCSGDYVQIGVTPSTDPDVAYRWFPSRGLNNYFIADPVFRDTVSRKYTMLYSTTICVDTFFQAVNIIPVPLGKTIDTLICMKDTMVLSALDTFQMESYLWSSAPDFSDTLNPVYDPVLRVFPTQTTSVFYSRRTKMGCAVFDTLKVDVSSFVLSFDPFPKLCVEDTMLLKVNISLPEFGSTFWYEWLPAQEVIGYNHVPTPPVSPDTSTLFYVTVNNENGCKATDSIWITVVEPEAVLTVKPVSCYGMQDGSIAVAMQGGDSPYTYRWQHVLSDTSFVDNLSPGTYHVTATDSNRCSTDTTITLVEPAPLHLQLDNVIDTVYCNNICNGEALAVASGGTMPYSFSWITGDTAAQIRGLCAGEYSLLLSDAHNCIDSATLLVSDTSDMNISYTSTPELCAGQCEGTIKLIVNQAKMPCVYHWTTGQTSDFTDFLCKGTYDVTVTDSRTCKRRLFPKVLGPELIEIDRITIVHPYCHGMKDGSVTVHTKGGTPPFTYYWDGIQGDSILSNISASGYYHLKIIDVNLCEFDTSVYLPDYDTLSGKYILENTLCEDVCLGKVRVNIAGGVLPYIYQWESGESTPFLDSLCAGDYRISVFDANHCEISLAVTMPIDSHYISINTHLWADTTTLYRSQSTTIYGSYFGEGLSYVWSPSDYLNIATGSKVISTPQNTITYTYTVSDTLGCVGVNYITIVVNDVICEEPYIFVPNAFSPNGDGLNDVLYVRGDLLEKVEFAVYNRWGEKLFETKDKNIGWDGTYKGEACSPGVYVYYLDATCLGGIPYLHKGNVSLIR
jgi:gliding motility-associated-like protein